mmetsp:Transcript_18498/g.16097  ORF Transcript_18498/g.16097 Transcript_18498/m.16097 type:complete len:341 (+) Transcript_18498:43-1065(+)
MKAILVSSVLLLVAGTMLYHHLSTQQPTYDMDELWSSWKLQYGKGYASSAEDSMRKEVFKANVEKINYHNMYLQEELGFEMGINQFADLSEQEFKESMTCLRSDSKNPKGSDPDCPGFESCPTLDKTSETSWDWSTKGAVTPIKNQGACGSCWAFGAIGSLEGRYFLDNNKLLSFSEQYIVDCDHDGVHGCEGGYAQLAMNWTIANEAYTETDYPYKGMDEACNPPTSASKIKINSAVNCVTPKDAEQMKAAVVLQPTAIGVDATTWQFYVKGIIKRFCGKGQDHNVLLVGFDTSEGYWKIKNSWGPNWGEKGYVRVAITDNNDGYGECAVLRCGSRPLK